MPIDHSPELLTGVVEVDPLPPKQCRGSGTILPPIDTSFVSSTPPTDLPNSPFAFVPRPFPPPSLVGVPMEYIIEQLHALAHNYWDKPETADCTLLVPVPFARMPFASKSTPSLHDPSGLGRRVTEPALNHVPRISLKLHVDYLSAHSGYLRALFSGASPCDLINTSNNRSSITSPIRTSSGKFTIPANRLPRLMPSPPNHPVLFLPVPDPTTLHLLIHWMYFGDTVHIEDALNNGSAQWEGIARNVEYLGLSTEIKIFLGRWYGTWLHPERSRYQQPDILIDEDSDVTAYSDEDDDDRFPDDETSATSIMDVDEDHAEKDMLDLEIGGDEPFRGRTKNPRCQSWTGPNASATIQDPRQLHRFSV